MSQAAYCLFDTPLGCCGIAWSERGNRLAATTLQLPEATREITEARIARVSGGRQASTPPAEIAEIIVRLRKHLSGEVQDLRDVAIDLDGVAPFAQRVYEAAREIPPGETRTYGELAKALRVPGAARAIGQALGKNPLPIIIPCHRVLAAGGRPGGFSAFGGRATKARLLAIEGASGQKSLLMSSPESNSGGAH